MLRVRNARDFIEVLQAIGLERVFAYLIVWLEAGLKKTSLRLRFQYHGCLQVLPGTQNYPSSLGVVWPKSVRTRSKACGRKDQESSVMHQRITLCYQQASILREIPNSRDWQISGHEMTGCITVQKSE